MFAPFTKTLTSALMAFSICFQPIVANAQPIGLAEAPSELTTNGQNADPLGLGGFTPEGTWLAESRDSTYEVSLCGPEGVSLCGRLLWVREAERDANNDAYIGKWMLYEAPRTKPAEWKGDIDVYGTIYYGTVKMVSMNELSLTGCVFLIACMTFSMYRTHDPDGARLPEDQLPSGTPPDGSELS